MKDIEIVNLIADKVLAYKPKREKTKHQRRKKKTLRVIAILTVALLLLFGYGKSLWGLDRPVPNVGSEPQGHAPDGAQKTENKETNTSEKTAVTNQINTFNPDKGPADEFEKKNEDTKINRRLMDFTGVLAIVAVLQLIIIGYQIYTANDTAEKELRAYVFLSGGTRFKDDRGILKFKIDFI